MEIGECLTCRVHVPTPIHIVQAEPDFGVVRQALHSRNDIRCQHFAHSRIHHCNLAACVPFGVVLCVTLTRQQIPERCIAALRKPAVIPVVNSGWRCRERRAVRFAVEQIVGSERLVLAFAAQDFAIGKARYLSFMWRSDSQRGQRGHVRRVGSQPLDPQCSIEKPVDAIHGAARRIACNDQVSARRT